MPPLSLLLIINNTTKPRTSDGQLHTFTTRHGQDDARKGSSNRPVGQPKKGSKTLIGQALNHSNRKPQRIFQHLASTIQSQTKQHVRVAFCLCLCLAQHNESYC